MPEIKRKNKANRTKILLYRLRIKFESNRFALALYVLSIRVHLLHDGGFIQLIPLHGLNSLLAFHLLHIISIWFVRSHYHSLIWLLYRWIAAKIFGLLKIQRFLPRLQHTPMRLMWKSNLIRYVRNTHASIIQLNGYGSRREREKKKFSMCAIHIFRLNRARLSVSLLLSRQTPKNRMNCLHRIDLGNFSIWFFVFLPFGAIRIEIEIDLNFVRLPHTK